MLSYQTLQSAGTFEHIQGELQRAGIDVEIGKKSLSLQSAAVADGMLQRLV
jgi:hypothetical protein